MKRRVLLVSNRLPVTVAVDDAGKIECRPSSGGLATALSSVHNCDEKTEPRSSIWVGWPGKLGAADVTEVEKELTALGCSGVYLTDAEVDSFYDNFSNGILWPLCHYLLDKVHIEANNDWETYIRVNQMFADRVAELWKPGDLVWVHDYQLMLVPELVRERIPAVQLGFFMHIPFPTLEVFRILPWRTDLLRGLLGADIVGFHTASYGYHFAYACSYLLGLERAGDVLDADGRKVHVGTFPIGINFKAFSERARSPVVIELAHNIKQEAHNRKVLLSVDRLDYTKGFLRRLQAIEAMLQNNPDLREQVHIIQVAVPTRETVDAYASFRSTVNETIGRINAKFASATRNVLHFMHRSVSPDELSALYATADVMMVTPIRDGMNLVAKEYVASREDNNGVLILSEFAGAATQLSEAVIVNPYDVLGMSKAIEASLFMDEREQRYRMITLRSRVKSSDVSVWAESFLGQLATQTSVALDEVDWPLFEVIAEAIAAPHLVLLLDYDGTMVNFAKSPREALPDAELHSLLAGLEKRANTTVHIVSGRSRDSLEMIFAKHKVFGLHAEHGLFSRLPNSDHWESRIKLPPDWFPGVRNILNKFVESTDGAFLEEKSGSMAFHYRMCEPELAQRRSAALLKALNDFNPSEMGFEVLSGAKVIEVHCTGIHKGIVISDIIGLAPQSSRFVAVGDDKTDEYLFKALPKEVGVSIHVGSGKTAAQFRLPHVAAVRALLKNIATGAPTPKFKKRPL